jgi:hypothetical protein
MDHSRTLDTGFLGFKRCSSAALCPARSTRIKFIPLAAHALSAAEGQEQVQRQPASLGTVAASRLLTATAWARAVFNFGLHILHHKAQ